MRLGLSRTVGSGAAWLAPLAFLLLPNCSFQRTEGTAPGTNLQAGSLPRNGAIFCDIEKPVADDNPLSQRHCATPDDLARGIPFSNAAVALNARDANSANGLGLDDSPEALARCGGQPEAVVFRCPFPEGCPVCVKCLDAIGPSPVPHADANAVCVARCEDDFGHLAADGTFVPDTPPDPSVQAFCQQHAQVSTNQPVDDCLGGICTSSGSVTPDFDVPDQPGYDDPRRLAFPVHWPDRDGMVAEGDFANSLRRTKAASGTFDSGAASEPVVTRGHAFFEFTAGGPVTERGIGFGPVTALSFGGITYGLDVTNGGNVFLVENGAATTFLTTYAVGDRFRVAIEAGGFRAYKNGAVVNSTSGTPPYPLRVVASFLEKDAALADIRIVHIR